MTAAEFAAALSRTGSSPGAPSILAARRVLVDGMSVHGAAVEQGIRPSAVHVAVRRIRRAAELTACPQCGRDF